MAAAAQAYFRGTERRPEPLAVGIAVAEPEIQHRAQRSGPVGGKSSRIKVDFADQIRVDEAHRASGGSLSREVIDVGYLDSVHEEAVLRRPASAHDQVVAVAYGRKRDSGIGAYDAGDVAVRTRAFLDFAQPDRSDADRTFRRAADGRGHDRDHFDSLRFFFELYFDERRAGRNDVFRSERAPIAQHRRRQPVYAGLHLSDREFACRVCHRPLARLSGDDDGGERHGLPCQPVDHPAADRIAFRRAVQPAYGRER